MPINLLLKLPEVRQKEGYDIKVRGATIQKGDRVQVKQVSFDGKHKLADTWEKVTVRYLCSL